MLEADILGTRFISIHALRVEGDKDGTTKYQYRVISIHALRVEGDNASVHPVLAADYFYPRPPGGGRLLQLYGL